VASPSSRWVAVLDVVIERHEAAEEAEVLCGDAGRRHAELAPDDLGDVAEGTLVSDGMRPGDAGGAAPRASR
jgi:hypothetical protein